jgi:hypothetical protein
MRVEWASPITTYIFSLSMNYVMDTFDDLQGSLKLALTVD